MNLNFATSQMAHAVANQHYQPADPSSLQPRQEEPKIYPPAPVRGPDFSPYQRCPLPVLSAPDNLRQFYRDGVPQYRSIPILRYLWE